MAKRPRLPKTRRPNDSASQKRPPEYAVGYCRPPTHSRFKPGKSGNPRGRPKGRRDVRTALDEALNQLIATQEGGRDQALAKLDAVVQIMVNQALRGRKTDLSSWLRLAGMFEATPKPAITTPVTANDSDIIEEFVPPPFAFYER